MHALALTAGPGGVTYLFIYLLMLAGEPIVGIEIFGQEEVDYLMEHVDEVSDESLDSRGVEQGRVYCHASSVVRSYQTPRMAGRSTPSLELSWLLFCPLPGRFCFPPAMGAMWNTARHR